jgi:hypothetical protein
VLPGIDEGFDPEQPTVFPTDTDPGNFPEESFYTAVGSTIDFPATGGRAVLTLAIEAAFANEITNGDQVVFARQRIYVTDGPANTTITFNTPYGTITVDTDASGKGRITEDISPAAGNFDTPLKGNIGPFVTWDTGPVTGPSGATYLGDPNTDHKITGGPKGNVFTATWPGGTITQDQFSVAGKIATNTGVKADAAVVDGNFLNVFATSEADADEVFVAAGGGVPSTPMLSSGTGAGSKSFYARIDMTGKTMPTSVTVRNIGDNPVSTSQVPVSTRSQIAITDASYDGTALRVAVSAPEGTALTLAGHPEAAFTSGVATVPTAAPPAQVTVNAGQQSATAPVRISGGAATPPGLEPTTKAPDPGPVCAVNDVVVPCGAGGVPADAAPTAKIAPVAAPIARGDSLVLDGSGSTNATSWKWTQVSGTPVTITGDTTAQPTVKPAMVATNATTLPAATKNDPAVVQLVASNGTKASAPVTVSVPIKADNVVVSSSRFRAGQEIRVDGTSLVPNGPLTLAPATQVAVYVAAGQPGAGKLIGTSPVDTTGAWSVRPRSTTGFTAFTAVTVVSSRGGTATFTGGTTR